MKPVLIAGTIIVNFALLSYTVGILLEQRRKRVNRAILTFLSVGVVLDITATVCMIVGSTNSPFSLHGILGYSSLGAMLTDTVLIWRHRLTYGDAVVSTGLHRYSRIAYIWWVAAYITGALLVFLAR